jgi:ATP-binding cassette subfamily B multidrug efflux pump
MKYILRYLKEYKKESILAPMFKMFEALFELFVPLVVAAVIDRGIKNRDTPFIIRMSLLLILMAVIGLIFSITAQYFASKAAVGTATLMRHHLFRHIQTFSFTELDTLGASTLITRMTSDINQIQNAINLVLRLFLRSPFIVFGAMIMAFTIDKKAALVFAVTIPLLSVVVFGIMVLTKPLYKKVQNNLDLILSITREYLSGIRVIRAFNKEEQELCQFKTANEKLNLLQKYAGRLSGLMNPLTYIIINASIIVLIWVGAIRVDSGILTQGQVVALYNFMTQILMELIKLANLIINITKALTCTSRVSGIFDLKSKKIEGNRSILAAKDYSVEFRKVCLRYKDAKEDALTQLSLKIKRGSTVGIIGGTGSGKTSLVNLIPRFYDATNGEVLVNGINVKDYTFEDLNRIVSIAPQKVQLFSGSIRTNLLFADRNASEQVLNRALDVSQSMEFVRAKEGQLDAPVEQEGRNLSGGQKQRLTIARALVKEAEILILDDSASALDYVTDAKLRKAIRDMSPHPTVFIVSQRVSSVLYADQIIVMDNGKIACIGKHEELLASCEIYQEIYSSQFEKEA